MMQFFVIQHLGVCVLIRIKQDIVYYCPSDAQCLEP